MLSVIHTNIRKTAMPRTGRTLDALVTGASGAGGGSVAAQGEQYWEIVTVGPDGSQLAQEDYYLRPRQELNVVSQRNLIAYGDVIAKSVDEEIDDAELPKAGYGITNFGLTAIKQGGGLMIDSNNLVYIDPNYAGGGGLDIEQLEQYLTANFYMKKNDPASYLLMTGYAMPETYAPVTSTDTVLTAIGKLERNFGNYVTIATQQTVTGKKTFSQDIIGQRDIICKSTSEAIADAELPIASKTQLGLIKVGSGFEIAADGTLNNTGTGGLTEVYWTDIKNPPTTLAGYGITDAYTKTQNDKAYARRDQSPTVDLNTITGSGIMCNPVSDNATPERNYPLQRGGALFYGENAYGRTSQIYGCYLYNRWFVRTAINSSGDYSDWKELAFLDSTVTAASKLSPGCKIWGQAFTGEKDITGSLTSVSSITMTGNINIADGFNILKGNNWIISANSQGQLLLNATGNNINIGYRGTTSILFNGGSTEAGEVGINFGNWNTDRLYVANSLGVGTSSPSARIHVIGDGLFTGDVIAKSASTAISDAELPIASATQLGLIKIGSGFTITADGTLNNTGSGGLTEVYWDDIDGKPTTLAGYGIKASDVLTTLKTVDGSGSGLDADTLDGTQKTALLTSVTSTLGNNLSVVVGGTTKSVAHLFATNFTPTSIPENANLNSYNIPGMYYCPMNATVATLDNSPTNQAFSLLVEIHAGYKQTLSEYNASTPAKTWTRNFYKGAWGPWRQLAYTTDNVASATKLQTARTINGTSFDGTANITTAKWGTARNIYIRDASQAHTGAAVSVDGSANEYLLLPSTITASLSGNATTATRLQTARTIWGNSFNGSANIGGTLTPLADNTYDLGTTSRRWRYLYFYGYNGAWVSGKTRAAINIESQNSSTSTYFPYLRIESKYGDVFNIGMLQSTSESTNQFGIFRFASNRTANGTDSSFYMRGNGNMYGTGTLTMNGDIIAKSTSSAISDSELPIASASTLGLIKVGSGLKITNGVLSVTGGSGGGSDVYWGSPNTNMVPLYVDGSYYELSRNNHSHGVSTSGSGNAVTGISFDGRKMILSKGSTFSLNGHTHSQYLTSLSRATNGSGNVVTNVTVSGSKITVSFGNVSGGGGDWDGGTISNTIQKGDGNFLRGTGGAGYRLYLDYNDAEAYVDSGKHFQWFSGTVKAMQVGNGYNYAETNWQEGSDMRKKNRLGDISNVLDDMVRVDIFRYTWKHIKDSKIYIGVGAQLIESIFPDVVSYNKEYDTYGVDYSAVGCIAFQGVKELYALQKQTTNEIDALKQRIALLEAENQNLWNIINEKEAA